MANVFKNLKDKYVNSSVVVKAAIWFTICSFLQQGIALITTPIFTRLLTEEEYGVWTVYLTWQTILSVFVTLNLAGGGFANAMLKFKGKESSFLSSMVGFAISMVTVWIGIFFIGMDFFSGLMGLPILYIVVMFAEMLFKMIFSLWAGQQRFNYKYKLLLLITVSTTIVAQTVSAVLVYFSSDRLSMRIYSNAGITCFFYLILTVYIFVKGKSFFNKEFWKYMFLFNIALVPHYLSQIILNQSDKLMIERMCGFDYAAFYGVSYTVASLLTMLLNSVISAFTPWIMKKLEKREYDRLDSITNKLAIFFWLITIIPIIIGPEVVMILAPPSYQVAIWVIPPVSCSLYFLFMYNMLSIVQFFYEKKLFIAISSVVAAGLNIGLNYIFIGLYGFVAAGYTTLVCYIFYCIANYLFLRRVIKKNKVKKNLFDFRFLFIMGGLAVGVSLLSNFLYMNNIVRYVFIGVLLILAIIFRKYIVRFFMMIKNRGDGTVAGTNMEVVAQKYAMLSEVQLEGLDGFNCWEALYTKFLSLEQQNNDFIHKIIRKWRGCKPVLYTVEGGGDIAFIYTTSDGLGRQDHIKYFSDLCETVDDYKKIMPGNERMFDREARKSLKIIKVWTKQITAAGINKSIAKVIAIELFRLKVEAENILKLIGNSKVAVTYCDALPTDYFIAYLCNKKNITTATVQHGIFYKDGYQYKHSHSNYFIANTPMSATYARNFGLHAMCGGLLSELNETVSDNVGKNEQFAVLLDGMNINSTHEKDNIKMIELAEQLSESKNIKYILRYHPADASRCIHNENSKFLAYVSGQDESMADLFNKVDFILVNQSTLYFQAISNLVPVMRFVGESGDNIFDSDRNVVRTVEDIDIVYNEIKAMTPDDVRRIKESELGDGCVKDRYAEVFNSILCSVTNQ